jgi:hypothetical protein|tara:strand:+ start:626 stop:739 length:114 start_codon:yes stop_codon:yes gene_type:complete
MLNPVSSANEFDLPIEGFATVDNGLDQSFEFAGIPGE